MSWSAKDSQHDAILKKSVYVQTRPAPEIYTILIPSLPTSKDHIPDTINIGSGCINDIERNVNAYIFSEDVLVTDTFSFPRKTFVYAEQVDEYSCDYLSNMHSNIVNLGQIFPELLNSLIDCLQSSCMLKRKYRNVLSARKQSF